MIIIYDLMLLSNYTFVYHLKFAYYDDFLCASPRSEPYASNDSRSHVLSASNYCDDYFRIASSFQMPSQCTFEMIAQDDHLKDDHHDFSSPSISTFREVVNCEFLMSVPEFAIFEFSFTCF